MYEGKTHSLFAKYAVPQVIGLLFKTLSSRLCQIGTDVYIISAKAPAVVRFPQ